MLNFKIENVAPVPHAAAPALAFTLQIGTTAPVEAIHLHTQIRIEPTRRGYSPADKDRLYDLFGKPTDFGRTVRSMLWTHVDLTVPAFAADINIELPVPCTYDFNIASTKYFAALDNGQVPLTFLFSGTLFQSSAAGQLQISRISWNAEADFSLPIATWREMMELYYPNSVWVSMPKDMFLRLDQFKRRNGLVNWEQGLEKLLAGVSQESLP